MIYDELRDEAIKLKYLFTTHEMNIIKYDANISRWLNNSKEAGFKFFCEIGFGVGLQKKYLMYIDAFSLAVTAYVRASKAKRESTRLGMELYDEHIAEYRRLEEKLEPLEKELIAALDRYIGTGWVTTEEPKDEND